MNSNKIIFISYMDFNKSSAGSARVRLLQKMLDHEEISFSSFTINDHLQNSTSNFLNFLYKNKYNRYFSYPLRILLYALSLKKFIIKEKRTTFYLYPTTRPLFDYFVVYYMKVVKRQRVFCEINEVRRYGANIKKMSFQYYKYLIHERLSKRYDGLICISTNIEKYFKKYNQNIQIIPILCNTEGGFHAKRNYNINEEFLIGFTGSINIEKENLDTFFSSLKIINQKGFKIKLNLYGTISKIKELNSLIKKYDLEKTIIYHGFIDQHLLQPILKKQDLLILPRKENNQNKFGFSTKLSEYLTSGVPVLVTNVSDNLLYLQKNYNCILADAQSSKSFTYEIEFIMKNYEKIGKNIAFNAFKTAEKHLDYKVHSSKFAKFIIDKESL